MAINSTCSPLFSYLGLCTKLDALFGVCQEGDMEFDSHPVNPTTAEAVMRVQARA